MLEKQVQDYVTRISELEANVLSEATRSPARLQAQVEVLFAQVADESRERASLAKDVREYDRQIRALSFQLSEKEKAEFRYKEDTEKLDQKARKLEQQIEEMVGTDINAGIRGKVKLGLTTCDFVGGKRGQANDIEALCGKRSYRIPRSGTAAREGSRAT
jgi:predicted RNase H-like nuclease (RuvC/YqgF family)